MKYFLDTEFIEGFHKPLLGKRRHYIDLISIGIVCEDGRELHLISNEYDYDNANEWVKRNVILPLYISEIHGDARNYWSTENFHHKVGVPVHIIRHTLMDFFRISQPCSIEIYGYYADYDWVLFCSIFGRMIDLPNNFPMYCLDLKQMMHERGLGKAWKDAYCPEPMDEHNALADAKWNKQLYETLLTSTLSGAVK